ncbi:MAG TPA: excinuclease ABC subunit UvrB [Candidatus Eremiobacteraceae bacterium]|nr:excinuclease ABC subunit UvrB [Candidatus Eremiobacteraceae bacterium]
MPQFEVVSPFKPAGDQPQAIDKLAHGVSRGDRAQALLGVTGSGKTATMAWVIEKVQKPTLVLCHNKTLAAQLCGEFREFFPNNAVEYFVSYFDYYQPEAYIASSDTYIEKDSSVNEEIERLRHSATQSLLTRRDTVIVASVSCIFGLGSPSDYMEMSLHLRRGDEYDRDKLLRKLVDMQYTRNDIAMVRGTFRVRGDVLEYVAVDDEIITRLDFFGDQIDHVTRVNQVTGEMLDDLEEVTIFPAKHFITPEEKLRRAIETIEAELEERLHYLRGEGKLLEAQRLEMRTRNDVEMLREVGYCNGIENYSRHLTGRAPGQTPFCLLDFFPDDWLLFVDESHVTVPQVHGMYGGDRTRKIALVEYGFRLPSALDNRPLTFEEFDKHINQVVYVSATPGEYEKRASSQVVEQIIRPTGLVDPQIIVKPTQGQVDDLIDEVQKRVEKGERVLVTTLTKKMAEDLTDYLIEMNIKARYLHSEVETLERIALLRDLRLGEFDVLVGINLLREGLDLPEVSLVAILDADKEGYLRSETSLIQTVGRAARHVSGMVLMYADNVTQSMERAINETERRRARQLAYNAEHNIDPQSIRKSVRDILSAAIATDAKKSRRQLKEVPRELLVATCQKLEREMKEAAKNLEFEKAAALRDELWELRSQLPDAGDATLSRKAPKVFGKELREAALF